MRYRAVKSHRPEEGEPLEVSRGDRLEFERRPTGWEGWLWCTNADGDAGWVPEAWVRIEGETCVSTKDYSSSELAVDAGTEVLVGLMESGWAWACTSKGQVGWVPFECLEKIDD